MEDIEVMYANIYNLDVVKSQVINAASLTDAINIMRKRYSYKIVCLSVKYVNFNRIIGK